MSDSPPSTEFSPIGQKRSQRTALLIAAAPLAAFLGLVAFTIGVGGWLTPVPHDPSHRVAVFEGTQSLTQSAPFRVGDSWELRWEHTGEIQRICWINQNGDDECLLAMPRKPIRQHGSVNIVKGGTYRVQLDGKGPWKLEVYEFAKGKNAASP